MRALVVVVMMVGCAASTPPPPVSSGLDDVACTRDDECAPTSFAGCCGCPRAPYAASKAGLAKKEERCAVVDCSAPPACEPVASPEGYRANCHARRCVLVPREK
jgi:hypothetical protein